MIPYLLVCSVWGFVIGGQLGHQTYDVVKEMDSCSTSTCVFEHQKKIIELAIPFIKPLALFFFAIGLTTIVGITRSQASLGHIVFGLQVINVKTGKPAGLLMTLLRVYLPSLIVNAVGILKGEYIGEVSILILFINFIVDPIMLAAHPKQQTVWDLILGQNVVVKE